MEKKDGLKFQPTIIEGDGIGWSFESKTLSSITTQSPDTLKSPPVSGLLSPSSLRPYFSRRGPTRHTPQSVRDS